MLPHEILARLGRGEVVPGFEEFVSALKGEKKKAEKDAAKAGRLTLEQRIDCLKASAPFYAPKLLGAVVKTNPNEANPFAELLALVDGKSRGLPKPA